MADKQKQSAHTLEEANEVGFLGVHQDEEDNESYTLEAQAKKVADAKKEAASSSGSGSSGSSKSTSSKSSS